MKKNHFHKFLAKCGCYGNVCNGRWLLWQPNTVSNYESGAEGDGGQTFFLSRKHRTICLTNQIRDHRLVISSSRGKCNKSLIINHSLSLRQFYKMPLQITTDQTFTCGTNLRLSREVSLPIFSSPCPLFSFLTLFTPDFYPTHFS